jgi:hypothetical protein
VFQAILLRFCHACGNQDEYQRDPAHAACRDESFRQQVPTSGKWVERYGGAGCILVEMLRAARESTGGVLPCRLLGLDKAGGVASATVASRRSPDMDPATAMTTTTVVKSKPAKAFALSQRSNVRWSSGDMDLQIRANSLPLMSLPRRALTGRHGSVELRFCATRSRYRHVFLRKRD